MSRIPYRFLDIKELSSNQIIGDSIGAEKSLGKWLTYNDGAVSLPVDGTGGTVSITLQRTTTSGEVLNGNASFEIVKSAADEQGEGVSLDIITDRALRGKPCKIEFNYQATSNFVYGTSSSSSDIMVYVYDVTNALLLTPYPNYLDGSGKFISEFQCPSNTDSLRLIFHIATTSALAYDFQFDNVFLGENPSTFIPLDSDLQSYTPTFSGLGTVTNINVKYAKKADLIFIDARFTVGTGAATEARMSLPSTLLIDSSITGNTVIGMAASSFALATNFTVIAENGQNYIKFGRQDGGRAGTTAQTGSGLGINNNVLSFTAIVKIQGWSGGFTSSDIVAQNIPENLSVSKNATQSIATATTTKVTWPTVNHDSAGGWDSTNNRYVVKTPGKFRVNCQLQFAQNATGYRDIQLYKNGSVARIVQASGASSGAFDLTFPLTPQDIEMNVGDYFEIYATQTSGGNLNIVNGNYTWLGIHKVETPQASINVRKIAFLSDEKAANTAGGTFTSGAFQTRTLNTEVDPFGIVTLSANQFTLQPGRYKIKASAPAFSVDLHKAKLRDITNSVDALIGTSEEAANVDTVQTRSFVEGLLTITSATTYELQHRCSTTRATNGQGLPSNFGVVEVYSQVEIEKLS